MLEEWQNAEIPSVTWGENAEISSASNNKVVGTSNDGVCKSSVVRSTLKALLLKKYISLQLKLL